MQEYISEAIVLDKETNGDTDIRVALFTKKFGKLRPKAKSARKITSKLSAHLEPGNLIRVRLIEKNGLQAVDALKILRLDVNPADLYFLNKLLADAEPEPMLWHALLRETLNWNKILKILGWDPSVSECSVCEDKSKVFMIRNQQFFCKTCASKITHKELILIDANG